MSEGLIGVIFICATILIIAGLITYVEIRKISLSVRVEEKPEGFKPTPPPVYEYSRTESRPAQDDKPKQEDAEPPLPIDPQNPPKTIRFPMNEANPPKCMCHGKTVQGGQRVVAWPDGPGYRFFCTED